MASTYVHLGLTKCASTTLQSFFAAHQDVGYIDRNDTLRHLVVRDGFRFDADAARYFFTQSMDGSRVTVHSHERLSGSPHAGHYDASGIADRILSTVDHPRVILCIRDQVSLTVSCYKQFIRIGGALSLADYVSSPWQWRIPRFDPDFYDYDRLLHGYQSRFGQENVLVLLMEELQASPQVFFGRIEQFLGIAPVERFDMTQPRNPGLKDDEIPALVRHNRLSVKRRSVIEPLPMPIDDRAKSVINEGVNAAFSATGIDFAAQAHELLGDRYVDSNRRVDALLDGRLAAADYRLDSAGSKP